LGKWHRNFYGSDALPVTQITAIKGTQSTDPTSGLAFSFSHPPTDTWQNVETITNIDSWSNVSVPALTFSPAQNMVGF